MKLLDTCRFLRRIRNAVSFCLAPELSDFRIEGREALGLTERN